MTQFWLSIQNSLMENRTLTLLLTLAILGMGTLITLNYLSFPEGTQSDRFISRNEVNGMAVEYRGLLYTLNFNQQNETLNILNRAVTVDKKSLQGREQSPIEFDQLVIYRFNKPDITLTPKALINQQLFFTVPEWAPGGFIQETDPGRLITLILSSYDT